MQIFNTFARLFLCGVGQQWSREDVHTVLVEETQELCLFCFLEEKTIRENFFQYRSVSGLAAGINRMCMRASHKLTFAVASMFSGSTSVRSRPISCTAPPSSGSVSQIMCSMIRLIRRMSWWGNT